MRLLVALLIFALTTRAAETGPWDLDALGKPPATELGERTGLVQELYYEGEPLAGKPTRVFAYLGRPEGAGPFPAMLLVHGGGGQAFRDWADHWAKRGYVALAMDTAGQGPGKVRLPDGGPDQADNVKFREFSDAETREMWTYHAVAAVLRGHSLLATLPGVDPARIGITGISWGGYLTCIVAGLDDRLKVAVPVYGCGFLGDDSFWKKPILDKMPADLRERWLRNFDPSRYLAGVRCAILFLNGTNDFAYPLDSYRKCIDLVPAGLRHVCIKHEMNHGHIWTFGEVDGFVDWVLKKSPPPPKFGPAKVEDSSASAALTQLSDGATYAFHFTADTGPWPKRKWQMAPAEWRDNVVSAGLPEPRPTAFYFGVMTKDGIETTSEPVLKP